MVEAIVVKGLKNLYSIIKAWAIILKMVKYEPNQQILAYYALYTTNELIT